MIKGEKIRRTLIIIGTGNREFIWELIRERDKIEIIQLSIWFQNKLFECC